MSALEEPQQDLNAFIKDIDDIRFAVMGASYSQTASPHIQSTDYIISSVQKYSTSHIHIFMTLVALSLCQVIGVVPMDNDKNDVASIHAKLTELRAAIGI